MRLRCLPLLLALALLLACGPRAAQAEPPTHTVPDARPVQLDGNVRTAVAMRPISPKLLVGGALGQAMTKLLATLDQSNVARAHAPLSVR